MVNKNSPIGLQEFNGDQFALMQQHVIDTQLARLKASQQKTEIDKEIEEKKQQKINSKLIEAQQLHQQKQQEEISKKKEAEKQQFQKPQQKDLLNPPSSPQINQNDRVQQNCEEQQPMSEQLTDENQSELIDLETEERGQESKKIHRCLVCNTQVLFITQKSIDFGTNSGAYDLFADETRTRHRKFRAIEVLEGVFKEELVFAPLHSTLICKKCFKLVEEIDEIEVNLLGKREVLCGLYGTTKSQIINNKKEPPERIETVTVITSSSGPTKLNPGRIMFDTQSGSLVMQKYESDEEEPVQKVIHVYEDDNGISNNNDDDVHDDFENDNGSPDFSTDEEDVQGERLICRLCGGFFRTTSHLNNHLNTHKASVYQCHYCHGSFSKPTDLQTHMNQHFVGDNTGKVNVEQNEKKSVSSSNHNRSKKKKKKRAPKPKTISCLICGKIFKDRNEMQDHRRIEHRGERPYECDICGNAFSQKGSLLVHKRITHLQEKRFKCEYCDKLFKFKRHLVGHVMSVHTGERPYKCKHCEAAFAYPQHCRKHMRIHTGVKPYTCNVCGKTFSSSDNCNAHMFTHTNKKKFECLICSVGCMRKNQMLDHIKSHGYTEDQSQYYKINTPGNLHGEMRISGSSQTRAGVSEQVHGESIRLTDAKIVKGTSDIREYRQQTKHYTTNNTQVLTTVSEIDYRGVSTMPHHTIAAHVVLPSSAQTSTVSVPSNMIIASQGHNTPHRHHTGNSMDQFYDMPMLFIDSENPKQVTEGSTYIVGEM